MASTNADGFVCKPRVQPEDLERLCDALGNAFGPGWCFKLDRQLPVEGGVEWVDWPGKQDGMYKTLRLDPTSGATHLKAFHGAPVWTRSELKQFGKVLEELGFSTRRFPKATSLSGRAASCTR